MTSEQLITNTTDTINTKTTDLLNVTDIRMWKLSVHGSNIRRSEAGALILIDTVVIQSPMDNLFSEGAATECA